MRRCGLLAEFRLHEKGLHRVLGRLEAQIMEILWNDSPLQVREVLDRLKAEPDLAYTTVMTVMQRLSRKGVLKRRKYKNSHVYRPAMTREAFHRKLVEEVLSGLLEDFPDIVRRNAILTVRDAV
jgi:predicted transcriptional regulator